MGLLSKLTKKIKYTKPTVDIVEFDVSDVITSSAESNNMEMAKTPKTKDMKMTEIPYRFEPSVFQKYPDGLPLIVLEYIDYSKFGAMLKQERLLPPSYDRKPIKVEIDEDFGKPRVILTFKSTTSESERMYSIYGYSVASSAKSKDSITILEVNHHMSEVWRKFAENVMWAWDRGYRYSLLDQKRKGEVPRYKVSDKILNGLQELERSRELEKLNKEAEN